MTVWYPVFVPASTPRSRRPTGRPAARASTGPTRIAEDVEIEFGRPGDASVEQVAPAPDAGPGDGGWRVLVGFVRYDDDTERFAAVTANADGVRVPTAGVRAGVIVGQQGRVEIRPRPAAAGGVPALALDDQDGGSLVFGLHTGAGPVAPLMTVDASGNLTVTGTLAGAQTSGTVLVASGVAFDGTVLPLPAGADPAAVASGALQVSVMLKPRAPDFDSAPIPNQRFISAECRVDDDRRVHCWGTWFHPNPNGTDAPTDTASACDYLVLVSVPKGGS